MQNYLCKRRQGHSRNGSFSNWFEVTVGVPKGSNLGSLPFNNFVNDTFFVNFEVQIL